MIGGLNGASFGFYRECAARRLHGLRKAFERGEVRANAVRSAALEARRRGVDEAAIAEDLCGMVESNAAPPSGPRAQGGETAAGVHNGTELPITHG